VLARGVAKRFRDGTEALAPIDLEVRDGEFVALVGPSGCGKTTLLNLIAGLARPSAGTLSWWGASHPDADRSRRLAYVFQSPTLMPWADIAANVRLPLDLAGAPGAEAERAVADALALVALDGFARHHPRELSGGMQMRASIARALVTRPALMLMDEPFAALDDFTRQRLDDELLALWRARGFAVVFVTHNVAEAVYLSTRVVVMGPRPGRIVDEVAVEAPSPRGDDFRTSPGFAALARRVTRAVAAAAGDAR
jgi:NitT/TauT family transport system ATP-binding protein